MIGRFVVFAGALGLWLGASAVHAADQLPIPEDGSHYSESAEFCEMDGDGVRIGADFINGLDWQCALQSIQSEAEGAYDLGMSCNYEGVEETAEVRVVQRPEGGFVISERFWAEAGDGPLTLAHLCSD